MYLGFQEFIKYLTLNTQYHVLSRWILKVAQHANNFHSTHLNKAINGHNLCDQVQMQLLERSKDREHELVPYSWTQEVKSDGMGYRADS